MKKLFFAICIIIVISSCVSVVYAESSNEQKTITKEYTIENLDKEKFYNNLENEIKENGKNYLLKKVDEKENKQKLEKNIEIEKSLIVDNLSTSEFINQIENKFDYNVDGYMGQVVLDYNSISINKNESYTREYKVYYDKNYYDLPTNDLYDIPKTLKVNGITYFLVQPIWEVAETVNINGQGIPTKYNAVMKYEGLKTEEVVSDYIAKFIYKGKVEKEVIKSISYKVEYLEQIEENNIMPVVVTSSTGSFIFICFIIFKMRNINIYNCIDGNYKLIKRVYIRNTGDVINLVNHKAATNKYKIKISNHLFKKIYGKKINFKYYDNIYKYIVNEKDFEITV